MLDTEMIIEQRREERDTRNAIDAAVNAVVGPDSGREIDVHMYDGVVLIMHGPDDAPPAGTAFAIARHLRDGRDFDASAPTDWHVISAHVSDRPASDGRRIVMGTRIVLNRSLRPPQGYSETEA